MVLTALSDAVSTTGEEEPGTMNDEDAAEGVRGQEAQLLRLSTDRIYSLSRRLATADQELHGLRAEVTQMRETLEETRRMRDLLASQVESLLRERERDYEERAELRRLLASAHSQLREILPRAFAVADGGSFVSPIARVLPQRGSSSRD